MRWLVLAVLWAASGCGTDVCGAFSGKTCIALEVRGPSSLKIDQLRIDAVGAFTLIDQASPAVPRENPVSPPLSIAVLSGELDGSFQLTVRAQRSGVEVSRATASGVLTHGHTTRLTANLAGGELPDLATQTDLGRVVTDLAGRDLAGAECDPTTQVPCTSGQKCLQLATPVCRPDGTQAPAQACTSDPDDNCQRGSQCLFPGDLTPGNGVCEQFCAKDADCHQPAVNVGGTSLPANGPHCLFPFSGSGPPLLCSLACNPVSSRGLSGCPSGSECVYASNASIAEFTFCDRAGSGTDGEACDANFRCADGFNCVAVSTSTRCRAMCRANTDTDCTGGNVCKAGAGGSPPMFGYCCPASGC